jgi:hypothetical protein
MELITVATVFGQFLLFIDWFLSVLKTSIVSFFKSLSTSSNLFQLFVIFKIQKSKICKT